jgi:hypothetical protein
MPTLSLQMSCKRNYKKSCVGILVVLSILIVLPPALVAASSGASQEIGVPVNISPPPAVPLGPGEFLEPTTFSVGNGAGSITDGDFNEDGNLDLAVANETDNTVSILLGKGNGNFGKAANFHASSPNYVATGHFKKDGHLDLVTVAYNFNSIGILFGDGKGKFGKQSTTLIEGVSGCSTAAVGDFNNDGNDDIAVACGNGGSDSGNIAILLGKGDGTFQKPLIYADNEVFLRVADVNGDGKLDLLGADLRRSTIDVFLGNGDGTFETVQAFSTGGAYGPVWLAIADFNGDGKLDVAAAISDYGGGNLVMLLGNGDGTFGSATNLGTFGEGFSAIIATDLNGDGKMDLAAVTTAAGGCSCSFSYGTTAVLLGNGDGTFQPTFYATGENSIALVADDFNSDHNKDLAVVAQNGQGTQNGGVGDVAVLLGNGSGTFQCPRAFLSGALPGTDNQGSITPFAATGDFNHDDSPDLAIASIGQVNVLLGNVDGTFQTSVPYGISAADPTALMIADFNGDGKSDLATVSFSCGPFSCGYWLDVLFGYVDGTFDTPVSTSLSAAGGAAAGDFNRDGNVDVAMVVGSEVQVFLGQGDGTFKGPYLYNANSSCGSNPGNDIVAVDFEKDKKLDLAIVCSGSLAFLHGHGDGTFDPGVLYSLTAGVGANGGIAVGDFNHDGKLDIAATVIGSGMAGVDILLGNGDGTFQAPVFVNAGQNPQGLAAGDFNGDGKLDLAAFDQPLNSVDVLLGKGDGTFHPAVQYGIGGGSIPYYAQPVYSLALGDFNSDGALDIATPFQATENSIEPLLNEGGTFITLTSSHNPSKFGQPVTFTASVANSMNIYGRALPTGSVTFMDGKTKLGTVELTSGQAMFTTSALSAGKHSITAKYSGDKKYNRHKSAVLVQTVN